jgi:hypothetical protein
LGGRKGRREAGRKGRRKGGREGREMGERQVEKETPIEGEIGGSFSEIGGSALRPQSLGSAPRTVQVAVNDPRHVEPFVEMAAKSTVRSERASWR